MYKLCEEIPDEEIRKIARATFIFQEGLEEEDLKDPTKKMFDIKIFWLTYFAKDFIIAVGF